MYSANYSVLTNKIGIDSCNVQGIALLMRAASLGVMFRCPSMASSYFNKFSVMAINTTIWLAILENSTILYGLFHLRS